MVIIYRTNINSRSQFLAVTRLLSNLFQDLCINIDLEDSEKVLRLESKEIVSDKVIYLSLLKVEGEWKIISKVFNLYWP
ncbi:nuclear transport factor 2 family protein [Pedobacter panaciterrae]|uniref:nuclear transport factor 2 family protein n=1 Tax=Pedobacter panaciterrae TaxID=363849 RepID=UPI00155DB14E|nr:nuclear transport factor 2 family protein [Pedobacter panaciterrae]NQX56686.1 nuclear transport factor 2 family protein [Pedobacter panaciterrae]